MIKDIYKIYKEENDTDGYVINIFYIKNCKPMKKYKEMIKEEKIDNVNTYDIGTYPGFIDVFSIEGSHSTLIYKDNRLVYEFLGVPKQSYLNKYRNTGK